MIVSMHNRSCADFLVDTLSYRVRWMTRCDLMEYAVKAGFSPSKADSSLKRCWKAGLLRRLVYNSTIGSIQEPLLIGRSNELMARIPSMLASRHNEQRHAIAEPTELIGIGPLACGLLGTSIESTDHYRLEAGLRLSRALLSHAKNMSDLQEWRYLELPLMMRGRAVAAFLRDSSMHSNQLIISPVFMSSVKLNRFLEELQQLEVVCEVW